ncbi:uncharacterized protein LOC127566899 [Pristis pectinata]|uniref:uncharacterized protein LOC127566899 n=1 Tax=Pristis pectinata TaxID=685728 RepID=UPI00223E28F7|nr:uncharacterized protein LOC127566899 [Pristis pectinata]
MRLWGGCRPAAGSGLRAHACHPGGRRVGGAGAPSPSPDWSFPPPNLPASSQAVDVTAPAGPPIGRRCCHPRGSPAPPPPSLDLSLPRWPKAPPLSPSSPSNQRPPSRRAPPPGRQRACADLPIAAAPLGSPQSERGARRGRTREPRSPPPLCSHPPPVLAVHFHPVGDGGPPPVDEGGLSEALPPLPPPPGCEVGFPGLQSLGPAVARPPPPFPLPPPSLPISTCNATEGASLGRAFASLPFAIMSPLLLLLLLAGTVRGASQELSSTRAAEATCGNKFHRFTTPRPGTQHLPLTGSLTLTNTTVSEDRQQYLRHDYSQHWCPTRLRPQPSTLHTFMTVARFCSNSIYKFADDTTVVGRISNSDESEYREERESLLEWCQTTFSSM